MSWTFSKSKLGSGRFLLTIAAALCFCWITVTLSYVIKSKIEELEATDILPYLSTVLIILSNIFTFYFTKKSENGYHDDDGTGSNETSTS